ncbi:glycoside hydrolase family 19 protein [Paraburkholderia dilworthii]|uniref:Lytic transglycosylase domain-containing protein n=1 Tax=Paraburkholderia dilworthii TaxID=948106 RepID=A0ABW9D7T4_9BURK
MADSQNHPVPAAASTDVPLKWVFPFSLVNKDDSGDPMAYMKALANATSGFYPIGSNGLWHGGIHFDSQTAAALKQDGGICAIADGEVVAYRLDSKYPELKYPGDRSALYSTGFVLIRHKLQLPPMPPAQQPAASAVNVSPAQTSGQTAADTLVFFSLYMHTMDLEGYNAAKQAAEQNTPQIDEPSYWEGSRYYRVGDKAKDKQDSPKLSQQLDNPFQSTDGSRPFQPESADYTPLQPLTGINIRDLPGGNVIGLLPTGSELTLTPDPVKKKWGKISSIKCGEPVSATVGHSVSPHAPYCYVFIDELDAVSAPQPLDTVVVLKTPCTVTAGKVIGHIGQYQEYTDSSALLPGRTHPMLHLETFAGPDLPDFIARSRERAKHLPPVNAFLEISVGAQLVTTIPDPGQTLTQTGLKLAPVGDTQGSRWIKVQPKTVHPPVHNVGPAIWVDASLANQLTDSVVKGWTDFPLRVSNSSAPGADFRDVFRLIDLEKLGAENVAKDDKGQRWWRITIGTKDGLTRQGWVCEKDHPLTRMCGPWDWPGFDLVDHNGIKPVDMLKRYLHTTDQLIEGEAKTDFEPSASVVNGGALVAALQKAIDTNKDGTITAQELKIAQQTPWFAEAISHLIVRDESEWAGGMDKWQALSPLMGTLQSLWSSELERIGRLQWWEQANGIDGFPPDSTSWYFHPIGLVSNFNVSAGLTCSHCGSDLTITATILKAIFPNITTENANQFSTTVTSAFAKYGINTCNRAAHFLGQCEVECAGFTAFRENLNYSDGDHLWATYPSALKAGLHKSHPEWTTAQIEDYSKHHLTHNDSGLGEVLFGDTEYPGRDFRGRGLLHMTWLDTYKEYKQASGNDVIADPTKVQNDPAVAADSSAWFWNTRSINAKADQNNVKGVTRIINPALKDFARRKAAAKRAFAQLNKGKQPCSHDWDSTSTTENGW